jgi:very-short-patch-repair endonuclease
MELSYFLTPNGRANSIKLREAWILKNIPDFYNNVEEFAKSNNINTTRFLEKIWYYLNNVTSTVSCKNKECGNSSKFLGILHGFQDYCSSKCSNNSETVKNSKSESCIKKYGVSNPYQSKEIIEKIKRTNVSRHGVENPMQSKKIKEQMVERSINKTGKQWSLSKGGAAHSKKLENAKKEFENKYSGLTILEYSEEKFGICTFKKQECGHTFSINKWQAHLRKINSIELCTVCNPIGSYTETRWQTELSDFLKMTGIDFIENTRKIIRPLELDYYLPNNKLAIELNGVYWHSINFKEPSYHLNKTELCESSGIQLIHIFEDEWIYKKEIVCSRILNMLGKNSRKIYARSCEIRDLTGSQIKKFLDDNHIQGYLPSTYKYGLFFNDELVSVMTFGPLRRALGAVPSDQEYEMYRFCSKLNTSVVGGASKLLKYFIRNYNPSKIISYADRRWSNGNLYTSLNFIKKSNGSPNYWYFGKGNSYKRYHRYGYAKHTLSDKIELFDPNLTEWENMKINKWDRIWDCGSLKFELFIK